MASPSSSPSPRLHPHGSPWKRHAGVLLSFAVLLPLFYHFSALKADRHNSGMGEQGYDVIFDHDQHPYLNVARKLIDENFRWITPRHRMPGYSFLLIPLYDKETAYEIDPTGVDQRRVDEGFFERAKRFNILLSCALLAGLFLFCRTIMPVPEALVATWAYAWLLAVFKAPYVQPEGIFYVAFAVSFVLLLRQLESPGWAKGIAAGAALAATFLLKSAVIPLMALFLACYALKLGVDAVAAARKGPPLPLRDIGSRMALGALPVLVFLLLVSPYLYNTWKVFGSPFWDAHSRHYMWMNTAEEKNYWRDLRISEARFVAPPGEEPPTWRTYFRDHSLAEIVDRPREGWSKLMPRVRKDYRPLHAFAATYCFWVVIGIAAVHWREALAALRQHWAAALMAAGFILGYTLLYTWYMAIRIGPRLILGLFLPIVIASLYLVGRLGGETRVPRLGIWVKDRHLALAVLAGAVAAFAWRVLRVDLWVIEGGQ